MNGLVQCGKVFVAESSDKGVGAFAACAIREGEVVERGIVRRLPSTFDGNSSPTFLLGVRIARYGLSAQGALPFTTALRRPTQR